MGNIEKDIDIKGYLANQIVNYSEQDAIEHIKLHFKENEFGVRIIVYPFNNERYWTDGYPVRAVMDK